MKKTKNTLIGFRPTEARRVALMLGIAVLAVFAINALDIRINISDSHVSRGIWRGVPVDSIEVGDIVTMDINELYERFPERSNDRVHILGGALLKRVAALPGACIERSGDSIIIDGTVNRFAITRPPYKDGSDPCKVEYPHIVADGCVWLMANVAGAFDSRYFGDVPMDLIREKNTPVITW